MHAEDSLDQREGEYTGATSAAVLLLEHGFADKRRDLARMCPEALSDLQVGVMLWQDALKAAQRGDDVRGGWGGQRKRRGGCV